jgi:hypothetical protein
VLALDVPERAAAHAAVERLAAAASMIGKDLVVGSPDVLVDTSVHPGLRAQLSGHRPGRQRVAQLALLLPVDACAPHAGGFEDGDGARLSLPGPRAQLDRQRRVVCAQAPGDGFGSLPLPRPR